MHPLHNSTQLGRVSDAAIAMLLLPQLTRCRPMYGDITLVYYAEQPHIVRWIGFIDGVLYLETPVHYWKVEDVQSFQILGVYLSP